MRAHIKGKVYDTDRAVLLGAWENGYPSGDSRACQECLYRTTYGGNYFLHIMGGLDSPAAGKRERKAQYPNLITKIKPLAADVARRWVRQHMKEKTLYESFATHPSDFSRYWKT